MAKGISFRDLDTPIPEILEGISDLINVNARSGFPRLKTGNAWYDRVKAAQVARAKAAGAESKKKRVAKPDVQSSPQPQLQLQPETQPAKPPPESQSQGLDRDLTQTQRYSRPQTNGYKRIRLS